MLYLGSALGLYFPWDICLSPGTTALASFPPRFVPPIIASLVTVAAVISVFYCFKKRFGFSTALFLATMKLLFTVGPRNVSGMERGPLSYCCTLHLCIPASLSSTAPPYPLQREETLPLFVSISYNLS